MNTSPQIPHKSIIAIIAVITAMMLTTGYALFRANGYSGEAIWIYDSNLAVRNVETADLNGDGVKDVIAGEYDMTYYGESSRVYAIDGETGDTLWSYVVNDGIRSMTIGDINNDGVMDAVAGASYNASGLADGNVHAINGVNGTSLWVFPIGATIQTVTVANLNGDQYPDVAVGTFDDNVVGINGNTGGMLWTTLVSGLWVNAVEGGDVNDDGIDDIGFGNEYLTNFDNHMGVIDGTDGSFIWDSIVPYLIMDVIVDNIDGDPEPEAVFGVIYGDDHGEIQARNGIDGALEWSYNIGPVDHSNGNIMLRLVDLDEDGFRELVVGTYLGARVIYAFSGYALLWVSDTLEGYTRDMAFGDVLGDKDVNIVAAGSDRIEVLNGYDGSLVYYYSVNGSMNSVSVADFNGDETFDIAAGGGADFAGTPPNPDKAVWALKSVQSPLLWENDIGEYGNSIALGDFNGDGCLDVVSAASLGDNAIAMDGNDGSQLWVWQGTANLYAATAGDFDNDGFDDAAVAGADNMVTAINGEDGSVLWQFTAPTDQLYRKCLDAADLNGDDNVDVIAGADNNMVYALNGFNGAEIWSQNVGGEVNEVDVVQMNNSGPLDVVVAAGDNVTVLDGVDGSVLWRYEAPATVSHVEAMDANDDGVMDVAAGIAPFSRQVIMVDGDVHLPIWTMPILVESNIHDMGGGDLDGDKVPDVLIPATLGTIDGAIAVSGDDGHTLWEFPTGAEVNHCMVYDVDNDGINEGVIGADDQNVYVVNGEDGSVEWSYSTAGDVMHIQIGDVNCDGRVNIVCITFGSNGLVYAFRTLDQSPDVVCGDANSDGSVNVADAVYIINYVFKGGPAPDPVCVGDANGDGDVNVGDAVYLISYVFLGGPPPVDGCCR